jgi:hypothetical protein
VKSAGSSLDTAMSYVIQRDSSQLTVGGSLFTEHRGPHALKLGDVWFISE